MQVNPILKYLLAIGAGTSSFLGAYLVGKFVSKWNNEIRNTTEDQSATQGRETASASNQKLNDQTAKLPKE